MQKLMKRFAVILMAVISTVCIAVFAAGCDKESYATDTFTVTVLDENGNAIDGTTFGYNEYDTNWKQVKIQFCSTLDGGCAPMVDLDKNGKATVTMDGINDLKENGTTEVELHIQYLPADYKVEYAKYDVDKIPLEITVTLVKA